jgi:hypothetical protein
VHSARHEDVRDRIRSVDCSSTLDEQISFLKVHGKWGRFWRDAIAGGPLYGGRLGLYVTVPFCGFRFSAPLTHFVLRK